MKTIVLLFLSVFYFTVLPAQNETQNTKNREVALTVHSLSQYGISYKFGNEKALWRIDALQLNNRNQIFENEGIYSKITSMSYGLTFGREFRKPVLDKFEFRYGAGFFAYHSFSSSINDNPSIVDEERKTKNFILRPGVKGILGFHYKLTDNINIGAESAIDASYEIRKKTITVGRSIDETITKGFNWGIDNIATLVITCKF